MGEKHGGLLEAQNGGGALKTTTTNFVQRNRNLFRVVLATALIVMVPFVAMQVSDEVKWSPTDFAIIGALLLGTGLLYELATRKVRNLRYRAAIGAALVAALLLVWADLAVGIFNIPGISGS